MDSIFQAIYREAVTLLLPFTQASADGNFDVLLSGLGLDANNADGLDLSALSSAVTGLVEAIAQLEQLQGPPNITAVESAFDDVKTVFTAVRNLPSHVSGGAVPPELQSAWARIESDLFGYVIAQWLLERHPLVYRSLSAFGVISFTAPDLDPLVNDDGTVAWIPIPVRSVDTKTLLALIRNPEQVVQTQLLGSPPMTGANAISAVASILWPRLQTVAMLGSVPVLLGSEPSLLTILGDIGQAGNALADTTILIPATDGSGPLLTLTLAPPLAAGARSSAVLSLGDAVSLDALVGPFHITLKADGDVRALTVDSAGTVTLPIGSGSGDTLTLTLGITGKGTPEGTAEGTTQAAGLWRIGPATGTHLTLDQASLSAQAQLTAASRAALHGELDVAMSLVLDFTDGDSFVADAARLIMSGPVSIDTRAAIGWAWGRSVYLRGGASITGSGVGTAGAPALNTKLPVHLALGPVTIDTLTVMLTPQQVASGQEQVTIQAGVDVAVDFGSVTALVTNIGLQVVVRSADNDGNLGPLDARLMFKPPDGAGLAIEASPVSGGGYLAIDAARGRYLGAVALRIGSVSVQGIAVLSTRIPGIGWSLVALADVTGLSVQLGFGVELTGVGLFVAVHRTMNVDGLQALARAGQLQELLFPADLAENAPRVAADLDNVFPPARGEFVVGPIVQLAWGASSLVTAELAIFIEFPNTVRVAVLGVLEVLLPEEPEDGDTKDAPLVDLTLDVLGVIDLSKKTVSLDLSLTHSSIAGMPLTGQAALRGGWGGADATFLLAIGGVNPHFTPPAGFPSLQRIGLAYGKPHLTIRLSSYVALSTNTLQFGAAIDLKADAGPLALTASVSFDALVQFKPFHLEVDLAIRAAVTLWGGALLALDVAAHLSGPGPWQLTGSAKFAVLGHGVTIPISGTFGDTAKQIEPAVVDVLALLVGALASPSNWTVSSPPGPSVITLNGGTGRALHPLGGVAVHQRVAPLMVKIDRLGADRLSATTTLSVSVENPDGGPAIASKAGVDTDLFAPGQFISLSDAERISYPSFEALACGVTMLPDGVAVPGPDGTAAGPNDPVQFVPSSAQQVSLTVFPPEDQTTSVSTLQGSPYLVPATAPTAQLAAILAATSPYQPPATGQKVYGLRPPTYAAVLPGHLTLHTTFAEARASTIDAPASAPVQYTSELPGQKGGG